MLAANYNPHDSWVIYGLYIVDNPTIRYIGYTTKYVYQRLIQHRHAARNITVSPVHKWMKKYGPENVRIRVLEFCPANNLEYLDYAERYWIYSFTNFGYSLLNCDLGGRGGRGRVISKEQRLNHSIRMFGSGNPSYGITFSEERKKRISESLKGKPSWALGKTFSEEHKNNISKNHARLSGKDASFYGKTHTLEARQKISKANKGKTQTEEAKQKISNAHKGRKRIFSNDHILNMSKAQKGKPSSGMHTRWHINRNIIKDGCVFCDT